MIRSKKRTMPYVPVASMGDIAFLLIIFFMLTSNFMKQANIELEQPESPDVEDIEKAYVTVSLDQEGQLWVDGREQEPQVLAAELEVLLRNIDEKRVHVKIDKAIGKEKFMPVLEALSEVGAKMYFIGDLEKLR